MPPREATNPFPDQFLSLDYDTNAPGIPHDPTPPPPPTQPSTPVTIPLPESATPFNPITPPNPASSATSSLSPSTSDDTTSRSVDPLSIDPTASSPSQFPQQNLDFWNWDNGNGPPTPISSPTSTSTMTATNRNSRPSFLGDENLPPPPTPSAVSLPHFLPSSYLRRSGTLLDQSLSDDEDSAPDMDVTQETATDTDDLSSGSDISFHSPTNNTIISSTTEDTSSIHQNHAFDLGSVGSSSSLSLTFHSSNTSVSDLKYFAERGCIVPLLSALSTPRLKTLGCRMLADYAKMPHRRGAVASNSQILSFLKMCMSEKTRSPEWIGREYAVETVRSLTATEESDGHLMKCEGMLDTLALVAKSKGGSRGRLHACIAIMNLSCGKGNKISIANSRHVLETMRDVMLMRGFDGDLRHGEEARLKATTCVKNLSNADANDAALLGCHGLVEALGEVSGETCDKRGQGSVTTTTNACLALMNLSISKGNKHLVFKTKGVMDALMKVIDETSSAEAKVKACSALSNLAIGYDNKIPMFEYKGFVESILRVIKEDDGGEARTKACSILWSFAAEMKNQVPVVQRGTILPVLVHVASTDHQTEARFKCVAALTLLAESLQNAIPLLQSGALTPLMEILHEAGPDPTQWKGQTASWCVGFLMNLSQSDEAVPLLREAGVVELLAPLLTLNHYQSLKAAMAVTFVCRYDEDDSTYDLLRKTETVIPKIISLLHNTLGGRGGNGYKYGVFTLRSSVGCIASLASGPDFMKERIATGPVFESLLRVISDFCVDGGTPGAIVGGGRDDVISATLAIRALHSLVGYLIPIPKSQLPFDNMEERLLTALVAFEHTPNPNLASKERETAVQTRQMIQGKHSLLSTEDHLDKFLQENMSHNIVNCCGFPIGVHAAQEGISSLNLPFLNADPPVTPVRTFLLSNDRGQRFAVPVEMGGKRAFWDNRVWCFRRGRFCRRGEVPDPNFRWTGELQEKYLKAIKTEKELR